jgi:EamA-like transporter family.
MLKGEFLHCKALKNEGDMESNNVKFKRFRAFLRYAKNHRIPIHPEARKIGIVCTLIGWALIAFVETAVPISLEGRGNFLLFINFLVAFGAGTLCLLISSLFLGKNFLKITEFSESKNTDQTQHVTHLSKQERRSLVFWRGLIAVVGYMLYSWSKYNTNIIDNSALFSTDAIMYALIMTFILKIKVNAWQWVTVGIVFLGICSTVSFNVLTLNPTYDNLFSLALALSSAAALAIIILLNTVIIQHEPPLRVAFFQCLIGFLCAAVVIAGWVSLDPDVYSLITKDVIVNASVVGIIYAVALIFFFNAFLYSEPFLIVMLGYSVVPFTIFFSWIAGHTIPFGDIVGAALIVFGGLSSVFLQFKADKKK